jgi:hypothetical protein
MRSTPRIALTLVAAGAALGLAACGGGGSSPSTPIAALQSPKSTATAPPTLAKRAAIGTATLTLVFPTILHNKSGSAVRARSKTPQFVDPTSGNTLDIWVDGTLVVDAFPIANTSSGVQVPMAIPLYSANTNQIAAFEYEGGNSTLLAIGESNLGTFVSGTTPGVSLSLYQNATQLGIVDLPAEANPQSLGGTYLGLPLCSNGSPPPAQFGVFPEDALGNVVPNAGTGGIQPVSLSMQTPDSGTSSITAQILLPGFYQLAWDGTCDGVTAQFSVYNAANFIYSDAGPGNFAQNQIYQNGFNNGTTNGPNQGIWNLINEYFEVGEGVLDQASQGFIFGTVDIQNT